MPLVVGVPGSTVAEQPLLVLATTLAGHEIEGPECAITVTLKLQEPPPSDDCALTTVVPTGKKEPEGWLVFMVPHAPKG